MKDKITDLRINVVDTSAPLVDYQRKPYYSKVRFVQENKEFKLYAVRFAYKNRPAYIHTTINDASFLDTDIDLIGLFKHQCLEWAEKIMDYER